MIFDLIALVGIIISLVAEAALYPGFWQTKIHISINTLVLVYLFFLSLRVVTKRHSITLKKWPLACVAVFMIILSSVFYFFEYHFFPNYTFSNFHLNPFAISMIGSIIIVFVFRPILKKSIFLSFSLYLLIVFSLSNLPTVIGQSFSSLYYAFSTRNMTYSQKMSQEIGPDYDYFQFVNSIVQESETITIPPWQLPWRHTGDYNYARAFLYPRSLVNGQLYNFQEETDYVMLTSETEGDYHKEYSFWPNFPIDAQEIIIYNFDTHGYQSFAKDFNPQDWVGKSPWGLIKIR